MLHEHKRVKHGSMPGDVPKSAKIRMREKDATEVVYSGSYTQELGEKCAKSFRKGIIKRGKKVQRRRDKRACGSAAE